MICVACRPIFLKITPQYLHSFVRAGCTLPHLGQVRVASFFPPGAAFFSREAFCEKLCWPIRQLAPFASKRLAHRSATDASILRMMKLPFARSESSRSASIRNDRTTSSRILLQVRSSCGSNPTASVQSLSLIRAPEALISRPEKCDSQLYKRDLPVRQQQAGFSPFLFRTAFKTGSPRWTPPGPPPCSGPL